MNGQIRLKTISIAGLFDSKPISNTELFDSKPISNTGLINSKTISNTGAADFRDISNADLIETARAAVRSETEATLRVLHILREIDRRKAFAERSYPSLFEFCVEYLGYKRDAAYRRISAMRAIIALPEIEDKIQNGTLSLSTVAQAQSYFVRRKKSAAALPRREKLEFLKSIESKSTRQIDEIFLKLTPKDEPKEKLRPIDSEISEFTLPWPKRVQEKLERLKALMAAENSHIDSVSAIEAGLDSAIRDYEKKAERSLEKVKAGIGDNLNSIHTKRSIRVMANGQCTFVDPISGARCSSRYKLENDHANAKAKGGSDHISNLRLRCRAHNQLAAIEDFGLAKMSKYFEKSEPNLN